MKIFAFNFRIQLQIEATHGHFQFENESIAGIQKRLRENGPLFKDQVFYVHAAQSSPEEAISLLKDQELAQKRLEIVLLFSDAEQLAAFFHKVKEAFQPSPAAGGLVQDGEGNLLMIFRNGFWDLPKGKIEKEEDIEEAAVREVEEETGIAGVKLGQHAKTTWHVYLWKGKWRWKHTDWFWMEGNGQQELQAQEEEGITEVRWWSLADLRDHFPSTYPQIQDLLRLYMEKLDRHEK